MPFRVGALSTGVRILTEMPTIITRRDRDRRMRGLAITRGICIEEANRGGGEEWDQEGPEEGPRSWERESQWSSSCSKRHCSERGKGVEWDRNKEKSSDRELR
ncbi:hypothetical protein AAC387_Pa10g1077 [Persea americana]